MGTLQNRLLLQRVLVAILLLGGNSLMSKDTKLKVNSFKDEEIYILHFELSENDPEFALNSLPFQPLVNKIKGRESSFELNKAEVVSMINESERLSKMPESIIPGKEKEFLWSSYIQGPTYKSYFHVSLTRKNK